MGSPLRLSLRPPLSNAPRLRISGQRWHTFGFPRAQLRHVPQLATNTNTT